MKSSESFLQAAQRNLNMAVYHCQCALRLSKHDEIKLAYIQDDLMKAKGEISRAESMLLKHMLGQVPKRRKAKIAAYRERRKNEDSTAGQSETGSV